MDRSSLQSADSLAVRTARLMFYSLLAITLMALDHRGRWVDQVHSISAGLVEPALFLLETPFAAARRIGEDLGARRDLAREVAELEQALLIRSARLGLLEDLAQENEELRSLLGAGERLEQEFIPAELMGVDLDPFAHRVVVKRGRLDGVKPGQPVLDSGGVLGQVERVDRLSARVILLTDPDHALPIQVRRTGARTIAYGSGSIDELRLNDLPMNIDLEPGDVLVTSGFGGRFLPGLPVGRVVSVDRTPGKPFASARVEPLASMDRSRHVLIVEVAEPAPAESDDAAGPTDDPAVPEADESGNGAAETPR